MITTKVLNQNELYNLSHNNDLNKIKYFHYTDLTIENVNIFITLFNDDYIIGLVKLQKSAYSNNYWLQYFSILNKYQGLKYSNLLLTELFNYCSNNKITLEISSYTKLGWARLHNNFHKYAKEYNVNIVDNHDKATFENLVLEFVDHVTLPSKVELDFGDDDAIPFFYYNNKLVIGDKKNYTHANLLRKLNVEWEDVQNEGRLWTDHNTIAFRILDNNTITISMMLSDIEKKLNITIGDHWYIEFYDENREAFYLTKIKDYFDENINDDNKSASIEEYEAQKEEHRRSPLFKKGKNIPDGWGSKFYSDANNIVARQKKYTSESIVSFSDYLNNKQLYEYVYGLVSQIDNRRYHYYDDLVFPIWSNKTEYNIGIENDTIDNSIVNLIKMLNFKNKSNITIDEYNKDITNIGTLFLKANELSFYDKPNVSDVKKFIKEIEFNFDIKIDINNWFIEYGDTTIKRGFVGFKMKDFLNNKTTDKYLIKKYDPKHDYRPDSLDIKLNESPDYIISPITYKEYNFYDDNTYSFWCDSTGKFYISDEPAVTHRYAMHKLFPDLDDDSIYVYRNTAINVGRLFFDGKIISFYFEPIKLKSIKDDIEKYFNINIDNWILQFSSKKRNKMYFIKDYLTSSKPNELLYESKLNESPDYIKVSGNTGNIKEFELYDDNVYPIWKEKNGEIIIGIESTTHSYSMEKHLKQTRCYIDENDIDNYRDTVIEDGRLFFDAKVLSFYQEHIELENYITAIKHTLNINIEPTEWYIEIKSGYKYKMYLMSDYLTSSEPKELILEFVDDLKSPIDNKEYNMFDTNVYPFWIYDNKFIIGTESTTHKYSIGVILEIQHPDLSDDDIDDLTEKYYNSINKNEKGRIWIDAKTISFWSKPNLETLNIIINKLNIQFDDIITDDWYIDYYDNENLYLKTISEFKNNIETTGVVFTASDYENKELDHLISPLLKKKTKIPTGWGSKYHSDANNIVARQKKYTSESIVSFSDYLNEYVDEIKTNNKWYHHDDKKSYPLWKTDNKYFVGCESTTHIADQFKYLKSFTNYDDIVIDDILADHILKIEYRGRLFLDAKTLAFNDKIPIIDTKNYIKIIESNLNIVINPDEYFFEFFDNKNSCCLVYKLSDYLLGNIDYKYIVNYYQ